MVASIIITTYNRPELLKCALKSALEQTYKDYEIIVVDDCSEPSVHKQVHRGERWDIKYIRHETNRGLSAARNTGIKEAKGEYIVCLDDDNVLLPEFLEETIKAIGDYDAVAVGRIIKSKHFERTVVPGISKYSSIDWGWLIKKSVFDEIQYDEEMRANEDTDFGIQFFRGRFLRSGYYKKFKATQLHKPLTIAHDSENDKDSLSFPTQRELQGMAYFFKKNLREYDEPKELWCLYRLMGRKFYRGGFRKLGIGYFLQGFWEYKTLRSFAHLFFILFGWRVYNLFMSAEEKIASKL